MKTLASTPQWRLNIQLELRSTETSAIRRLINHFDYNCIDYEPIMRTQFTLTRLILQKCAMEVRLRVENRFAQVQSLSTNMLGNLINGI